MKQSIYYIISESPQPELAKCGILMLRSNDSLKQLSNLIHLLDVDLVPYENNLKTIKADKFRAEEYVVAFGAECAGIASVYAIQTGRKLQIAESLEEVLACKQRAVLLGLEKRITSDLLLSLYQPVATGDAPVCGILCGATLEQLYDNCAAGLITFLSVSARYDRRVDIYPTLPIDCIEDDRRSILGNEASSDQLREMASRGFSLLSMVTHSNGLDAKLGSSIAICPIDSVRKNESHRPPRCVQQGVCFRHNLALADERLDEFTLSPDKISARIFVFASCNIFSNVGVMEAGWSLGKTLVNSRNLGALITSWGFINLSPSLIESLTDDILNYESLGVALGSFLKRNEVKRQGVLFALFGDPAIAGQSAKTVELPANERNQPLRNIDSASYLAKLNVLRLVVSFSLNSPKLAVASAAKELLELIAVNELAIVRGDSVDFQAEKDLSERILSFVAHQGWFGWNQAWISIVKDSRYVDSPCIECGAKLLTIESTSGIPGSEKRIYARCNHCGLIDDKAYSHSIFIDWQKEEILWKDFESPPQGAAVIAVYDSVLEKLDLFRWEGENNDNLQLKAPLPETSQLGHLYLSVIHVENLSVNILTRSLYRDLNGWVRSG